MTSYARAIYEFNGVPGSSEISITVGEVLNVLRTDVGEGWWEGKNNRGEIGLFPAAYVQVLSAAEAQAHNQPKPVQESYDVAGRNDSAADDYNDGDDWEDDWDDDNETYSEIGPTIGADAKRINPPHNSANNYDYKNLPVVPSEEGQSAPQVVPNNTNTLRKAGMFSKSSDSYILGAPNKEKLPESEVVYITAVDSCYRWTANQPPYTVVVDSPKKETKFKGMKTFIAYQLTPSFNNISVSRRYKHFDWLHERLVEKFCMIPIPPLPDKQISGRYEEQFVEHRRVQLQEFVDWVCRHPVLSKCGVWLHFLTCTDDKMWKTGKRKAERDYYVGMTYCWAILPPEKQLLQSFIDSQMDSCSQLIHSMDASVKNLLAISNETAKRYQVQYKKEFYRVGDALLDLNRALAIDERRSPPKGGSLALSSSVERIGEIYKEIGQLFYDQPKLDWIPLSDRFHIYRGILNSFPEVISIHKGAMQRRKDCERSTAEQKMTNAQLADVNRRTDVISYAVLAEMSHFRDERDTHLKQSLKQFIGEQIKFYRDIVVKLENAYKQFD